MSILVLLISVFIPQEFTTAAIAIVEARHAHIPAWEIHLIWLSTSIIDMYIGYLVGRFTKTKARDTRFYRWVERWMNKLTHNLGTHGKKLSLALLGIVDFPYVNAFLAAWFDIPREMAFLLTLAGNFLWYLLLWATVLGLSSFISDPDIIILILVGIGGLSYLFLHPLRKK